MKQSNGTDCAGIIGIRRGIFFTSLTMTTEMNSAMYIKVSTSSIDKDTRAEVVKDTTSSRENIQPEQTEMHHFNFHHLRILCERQSTGKTAYTFF